MASAFTLGSAGGPHDLQPEWLSLSGHAARPAAAAPAPAARPSLPEVAAQRVAAQAEAARAPQLQTFQTPTRSDIVDPTAGRHQTTGGKQQLADPI